MDGLAPPLTLPAGPLFSANFFLQRLMGGGGEWEGEGNEGRPVQNTAQHYLKRLQSTPE